MGKTPEFNAAQRSRVVENDKELLGLALEIIGNRALGWGKGMRETQAVMHVRR